MSESSQGVTVAEFLPIRPCHGCGSYDDHPRHVHAQADGTEQIRHMDCCAAAGCPDGSCPKQIAGAGGAKGAQLRAHLVKGGK
jgi:hypothetical protein